MFIQRQASGISQIGCLDEAGVVSVWNIIDIQSYDVYKNDLHLNLNEKVRMNMSYSDNLNNYPEVVDYESDKMLGIELEFDPNEPTTFFFSTGEGLFRFDRSAQDAGPIKLDTLGLNSPTALSMSDKGFLLAAYSCGSIT